MNNHFDATTATAAGYGRGETTTAGLTVAGPLAVEVQGPDGAALIEGSKSELLRFATDIIEATLIADARAKDREARLAAFTSGAQTTAGPIRITLTPEQAAAFKAGHVPGMSIDGQDLDGLTPRPAAGGVLRAYSTEAKQAALRHDGSFGKYTRADLEAMTPAEYIAACQDLLGTTDEPDHAAEGPE